MEKITRLFNKLSVNNLTMYKANDKWNLKLN